MRWDGNGDDGADGGNDVDDDPDDARRDGDDDEGDPPVIPRSYRFRKGRTRKFASLHSYMFEKSE